MRHAAALLLLAALSGCVRFAPPKGADTDEVPIPAIRVVLFTHIEDNTPAGDIPSGPSRAQYVRLRASLIAMAELARAHQVKWVLQPDYKFLLAAAEYESAAVMRDTGGVNVLRYLRDTLGVAIDPHSHEQDGYNYTDVAHLLSTLGVGGSTVMGGHIYDPAYDTFQRWDRYATSGEAGLMNPTATWQATILMGAATPGHVADPIVSGVWEPNSASDFFTHNAANAIASVGSYTGALAGITTLRDLYTAGTKSRSCMLTLAYHITPIALRTLDAVERDVLVPLGGHIASGYAVATDFTSLVTDWRRSFTASTACIHKEFP